MGSSHAFLGQTTGDTFLQSFLSAYFPFLSIPLASKVSLQREKLVPPAAAQVARQYHLHLHPSARKTMLAHWWAGWQSSVTLSANTSLALQPPWGPIYSLWLQRWMISGALVCWVDNFFFFFSLRCSICCKSKRKEEGTTYATMMLILLLNYLFKAPYFIFALQSFQSTTHHAVFQILNASLIIQK